MTAKQARINLRLGDNHRSTLDKLAAERGVSVSEVVRAIIAEYLERK